MAEKRALCWYNGLIKELTTGDTLVGTDPLANAVGPVVETPAAGTSMTYAVMPEHVCEWTVEGRLDLILETDEVFVGLTDTAAPTIENTTGWQPYQEAYPPDTPIETSPADGAVDSWIVIALTASAYNHIYDVAQGGSQFQVATDSEFTSIEYDSGEISATNTHTPPALDPLTTYYWRARYKTENDVWGEWSGGAEFTTEDAVAARYWRFRMNSVSYYNNFAAGDYPFAMDEIQVFTGSNGTGTNIALSKTVSASSIYSADYYAGRAVDGLLDDWGWRSDMYEGAPPQWFRIDFGSAAAPKSFRFQPIGNMYPSSLIVEYSDDGSTWTTAAIITGIPDNDPVNDNLWLGPYEIQ